MKTITMSVNMVDNSTEATPNAPAQRNFVVSMVQKNTPTEEGEVVDQTPFRVQLYSGPSHAEAEAALATGQDAMAGI